MAKTIPALAPGAWRHPETKIEKFSAEVFHEAAR